MSIIDNDKRSLFHPLIKGPAGPARMTARNWGNHHAASLQSACPDPARPMTLHLTPATGSGRTPLPSFIREHPVTRGGPTMAAVAATVLTNPGLE